MATGKKSPKKARATRKKGQTNRSQQSEETRQSSDDNSRDKNGFSLKDQLVEEALISGEHRDLLEDYFGEDLYEELQTLALQSRRAQVRGGPKVLILPGIMGSKLGIPGRIFDDTIWVDPIDIIAGNLTELELKESGDNIESLGVLLFTYLKIKLKLRSQGFDAEFYHYDWRHDIQLLGKQLADTIQTLAKPNGDRKTPIYLVAHSMGGLVSRAAIKVLDDRKKSEYVARLIMLGTPNYGSFSPVQVLSGYHSLIRKVAAIDLVHSESELVNEVFSTFTGLYQMLPAQSRYSETDLYSLETWPDTGIKPRASLLKNAPKIHDHLTTSDERFVLIAGVNKTTVIGVHRSGDGFVFTQSLEGDGTVPLALAQLDNVTTYYVDESHGSLPNNSDVTKAVIDILQTGKTQVLKTTWTPRRDSPIWQVSGEEFISKPLDLNQSEKGITRRQLRHLIDEFAAPANPLREIGSQELGNTPSSLSSEPIVIGRKRQGRIDLNLARGDITQVDTRAVVLGLFKGVKPAGPANAMDELLDGAISDFTDRRMLSANAGEVFIMPANRYRLGADMIVFAGLGSYDLFTEEVLRLVGENVARALIRTKVDEFATVMVGLGSGLSLNDVLKNLMQGFIRGITDTNCQSWLRTVTFCEGDPKRFEQMHREVLRLSNSPLFDNIEVTVDAFELPPAPSIYTRSSLSPPRSTTPVYLIVREITERWDQPSDSSLSANFFLRASLLTSGSRATVITDTIEIIGRDLNRHLDLIETQGFRYDVLEEFGRTLGEMVLPPIIRRALSSLQDYHLVVLNDARSSRIPWETISIDGWFPAAVKGLSRKYEAENLTVAKWLEERRLEPMLTVLLIVDPTEDLKGAVREGELIKQIFDNDPNITVHTLLQKEATYSAIQAAFRTGQYDVVHYAGHAFYDPWDRARSGIVCYGQKVLSGTDLVNIERLPALMFFNACESGRVRGAPKRVWPRTKRKQGEYTAGRLQTNIGLAESLMRAGVGNYIGTYWPVEDKSALDFGETFYHQITQGTSVGEAMNMARTKVRELSTVDWADYIHYGNADFVVKKQNLNS